MPWSKFSPSLNSIKHLLFIVLKCHYMLLLYYILFHSLISFCYREGTYVRVNGHLQTFQSKKQLNAFSVRYGSINKIPSFPIDSQGWDLPFIVITFHNLLIVCDLCLNLILKRFPTASDPYVHIESFIFCCLIDCLAY